MKKLFFALSFLVGTSLAAQMDANNAGQSIATVMKDLPDYTYELNKTYTFQSGNVILEVFLDKSGNATVKRKVSDKSNFIRMFFLHRKDLKASVGADDISFKSKNGIEDYWFIPFEEGKTAKALIKSIEPILFSNECSMQKANSPLLTTTNSISIYMYRDALKEEQSCTNLNAKRKDMEFDGVGVFFPAKSVKFIN